MAMMESFSSYFEKKKQRRPNLPKGEELEYRYHEHVDTAMHHLHQLHAHTHPDGEFARSAEKLGLKTHHIHELHQDVAELIKRHTPRTSD